MVTFDTKKLCYVDTETGKSVKLEFKTDTIMPEEFLDVGKVLEFGAQKYGKNNWLEPGVLNLNDNFSSISRHSAKAFVGRNIDNESGLSHHLHAACRHLMAYTILKRQAIIDEKEFIFYESQLLSDEEFDL